VAPRRRQLRPEANEAAIVRVVDAVLLEQDEMAVKRARYVTLASITPFVGPPAAA
jgi:hypothetical protein